MKGALASRQRAQGRTEAPTLILQSARPVRMVRDHLQFNRWRDPHRARGGPYQTEEASPSENSSSIAMRARSA